MEIIVNDQGAVSMKDVGEKTNWTAQNTGWITLLEEGTSKKLALGKPSHISETENSITFTFRNDSDAKMIFNVQTRISMTKEGVVFEVLSVNTNSDLVSLEYPSHLLKFKSGEADSYLAVPYKQGAIIPGRLDAGFMRFMHNTWANISDVDKTLDFESGALNMSWFGAKTHDSSLFCYIETPDDCALHIVGNAVINPSGDVVNARQGLVPGERVCSLAPVWKASSGGLGYKRSLRLETVDHGYVGMSKRYLDYVIQNGKYVSLAEKIKRNPMIEKLIGAPDIKVYIYTNRPDKPYFRAWSEPVLNGYSKLHTTFAQVGEMAMQLKEAGIQEALFLLGGWNRMGYDREHVDMWPPAELAGGESGLSELSKKIRELGYVFSLHDNYQDFYPDAPTYDERYLMKNKDGSVQIGGIWDGGLCHLICSEPSMDLIRRNIGLIEKKVDISSYYLDTITAAKLYECFDADHPLTRTKDKEKKKEVLKFLSEEKGLIAGGEGGSDWALEYCPFFEGLPGSATGYSSGIESPSFGIAAPLFNLVYHDAVVCYWQHGQPFGREDHANHVLHDLLSGQPSSWSLTYDQWSDLLPLIKECYQLLGRVHRKTAFNQMISHEYLSEDYALQKSEFAEGTKVVVNYGITTKNYEGTAIPPKGFMLQIMNENSRIGCFSREIQWTEGG